MSLAFLYNVASCIAYALAIAAYGSLYYVERKPGYIFTALIFFAYAIDIVLLFMGGADSYLDSGLRRQPQPPPAVVYRIVDGPAALPEGL